MIIPALLESDMQAFQAKLHLLKDWKVEKAQVDFCDGKFVNNTTIHVESLEQLPREIEFEAHLMVQSPSNFEIYKDKGFQKIILHYGSFASEQEMEQAMNTVNSLGLTVGLAINPDVPVSVLRYDVDTVNDFTVLSVTPGKQGQQFIEETYQKVGRLRELDPEATIEVDGGVNMENAKQLLTAGATDLAVGSGIFGAEDPKAAYEALVKLAK